MSSGGRPSSSMPASGGGAATPTPLISLESGYSACVQAGSVQNSPRIPFICWVLFNRVLLLNLGAEHTSILIPTVVSIC